MILPLQDLFDPRPFHFDTVVSSTVDGIPCDEYNDEHGVLLSQTVATILSLAVGRGAPRPIQENFERSSSEGDTDTTCLDGTEKDTYASCLELLNSVITVFLCDVASEKTNGNTCSDKP